MGSVNLRIFIAAFALSGVLAFGDAPGNAKISARRTPTEGVAAAVKVGKRSIVSLTQTGKGIGHGDVTYR